MKTTLRVALALSLIVAATQNADAQTTWQPAGGHKQIVLWPDGPPDPRPGVGVEALHYALNRETNQKKLVGGKPYMYIKNVTQPTITIYPPPKKPPRHRRSSCIRAAGSTSSPSTSRGRKSATG